MKNRREFLAAAGGVVFTSCASLPAAPQAPRRRRQVIVRGKRIRTLDVHAHCLVPEALALMDRAIMTGSTTSTTSFPTVVMNPETTATRLEWMDEQGIDVQVLQINSYWYAAAREVAERIVRIQNEKLAEICAQHPDRFAGLASVALQYPELAAAQLEDGVKRLGLRGAAIGGSVNGEELSARKFDPFWTKAQELDVLIFLHPQPQPDPLRRFQGNGALANVIGNPLETTIALSHLIFDGTLDRFSSLKICAAHGGGYLPAYADRSDHGCMILRQQCGNPVLKKRPTEYLRDLYFDSLVFTPEALRHLVAVTGPDRVVMGSDHPYPWSPTPVDHILSTPGLSNADRRAILGETAARVLGLPRV